MTTPAPTTAAFVLPSWLDHMVVTWAPGLLQIRTLLMKTAIITHVPIIITLVSVIISVTLVEIGTMVCKENLTRATRIIPNADNAQIIDVSLMFHIRSSGGLPLDKKYHLARYIGFVPGRVGLYRGVTRRHESTSRTRPLQMRETHCDSWDLTGCRHALAAAAQNPSRRSE